MFGGAKLSGEVSGLLEHVPYETKSFATVRVDAMPVHVYSWDPIDDPERSAAVNDPSGTALFVGAWALDDPDFVALLPRSPTTVELVAPWRPMTYDDVRNAVEAHFGPLGMDPLPRRLDSVSPPTDDCPACAGEEFRLVLDLAFVADFLCDQHHETVQQCLDDSEDTVATNEVAWTRWEDAALRLDGPHVPRPLRVAFEALCDDAVPYDLLAEARVMDELVQLADATADLEDLLDDLVISEDEFDDWSSNTAYRLGIAGEFELATSIIERLDRLLPDAVANRHSQLAVTLAEAGQSDGARHEITLALDATGRDPLTEIQAGSVYRMLDDAEGARRWYETAIETARDDEIIGLDYAHEAWMHLEELATENEWSEIETQARAEQERIETELRRRQTTRERAVRSDVEQWGHKVGRNDPCPCGSGRKYKQCHARH